MSASEAQHQEPAPQEPQARDPNTIFIGKKPVMNYVLACLTTLQNGSGGVSVKARGRAISKAVDVAQILTKRFATDIAIKKIAINTEQVKSIETGAMNNVSSIEIRLEK
ncbi:MAG: DNA-binding protein Alba [Nitrososphaerales archaeon]|nr:DNA-binding protein Alba [Nitrososphaerales archaeon]